MDQHRAEKFPLGAALSASQLAGQPYELIAQLRTHEPVSWIPALNGWFVSRRDLVAKAMRDDVAFTVDDPRFTTAAVLGPSMLSLEGAEHHRHRSPFAPSFRPNIVRDRFEAFLEAEARQLLAGLKPDGAGELRTGLAGPLAVAAITKYLGLENTSTADILDWYSGISNAILALTVGQEISASDQEAVDQVRRRVETSLISGAPDSLVRSIDQEGRLQANEIASSVAVIMFGAIETAEGMTTNVLWHLLTHPDALSEAAGDRDLVAGAIDESLRLEPAAAVVDRYTTSDVDLGGVSIPAGDLVTLSLLGANRDPAFFVEPDRFVLHRSNARQHVTFAQGPHACIGVHLARLETTIAVNAVLDVLPDISLDHVRSTAPEGLVFRKCDAVWAKWTIRQ